MTLFRQFFFAHLKGLMIWLAVGALLAVAGTRSAVTFVETNAIAAMPQSLLALYGDLHGMNSVDVYLVILIGKGQILIPPLYAVTLALSVMTREVDRRTVEFLLALPVLRMQVLAARIAVLVLNVSAVVAAIWAVLRYDMAAQGYLGTWSHLSMVFINLWLLSVALGTITLAASMWIDDYSLGVKLALGFVTLGFFLEYVLKAGHVSRVGRMLSPFSYVDISGVMRAGSIATSDAVLMVLAIATGLAVSFWAFDHKQFSA